VQCRRPTYPLADRKARRVAHVRTGKCEETSPEDLLRTKGPWVAHTPRVSYWARRAQHTSCGFPHRKPHTRPRVVPRIGNPGLSAHFAPDVGFREPRPFAPKMHRDSGCQRGPNNSKGPFLHSFTGERGALVRSCLRFGPTGGSQGRFCRPLCIEQTPSRPGQTTAWSREPRSSAE
jgi:hypothetical protein